MSKSLKLQVIEKARALVEDASPRPYQITDDLSRAHDLAISAVRPLYGSATLVNVNDVRGHAAVLALLDEVLAVM